jgi:hypothetical protein
MPLMPRRGKAIIDGASQDLSMRASDHRHQRFSPLPFATSGLCIINDRHARTELHIDCCASTATQKFPTGS